MPPLSVTPQGETSSSSGINRGRLDKEDEEEFVFVTQEDDIVYENNLDLLKDVDFSVVPMGEETPENRQFRIQRLAQHVLAEHEETSAPQVAASSRARRRTSRKARKRLTGNQRDKIKGKGRYVSGFDQSKAPAGGPPAEILASNEKWVWAQAIKAWVIVGDSGVSVSRK